MAEAIDVFPAVDNAQGDVTQSHVDTAQIDCDIVQVHADVAHIDGDVAQVNGNIAQIDSDVAQVNGNIAQLDIDDGTVERDDTVIVEGKFFSIKWRSQCQTSPVFK